MCGIYGRINRNGDVDKNQFIKSLDTLEKRGPDTFGTYFGRNIALGSRRLSIIDLSDSGKQPIFSEDESVGVICNGEIYNYLRVKKELKKPHIWRSNTDTEVLVHGYEEWGQGILEKIEGMFAFAIYDKRKNIITLARDHFGKKPVYYYLDDEVFCFASELKAIIDNPEIKGKLKVDQLSLIKFLFYGYIPSPNSVFDKIKKLEPSATFKFDIKKWKIINKYQYWKLEDVQLVTQTQEEQVLDRVEDLIKKSIEKRLMSDVPLGIFLSGGVDSSLVAYYLSQASPNINSFTVCYKDYKDLDESKYAERVAKKLGLTYNLCYFEGKIVKENFLEMMDYLDEPIADAAITPLYFISKFARDKITVVLSGDGGDEIFGGYAKYKAQYFIEKFGYLKFVAELGKRIFKKDSSYYKLLSNFDQKFPSRQFIFGSGSFSPEEVKHLVKKKDFQMDKVFEEAFMYDCLFKQNDVINRSLYLDCKIQLPDWYLVKGDRATMSNSLEMRNPLLDKEMAEFTFSLDRTWKIRDNQQKYLLKKLASKYIDRDIIYRDKKGFGVPLDEWIRKELKSVFDKYLLLDFGFFDMEYINRLYREHLEGKRNNQFKLLRVFCFNYWYRKYFL